MNGGAPVKNMNPNQAARIEALHYAFLGAGMAMLIACWFSLSPLSMGIAAVGLLLNACLLIVATSPDGASISAVLPWCQPEYTLLLTAKVTPRFNADPSLIATTTTSAYLPPSIHHQTSDPIANP